MDIKRILKVGLFLVIAALGLGATTAWADTIGPSCGSCFGATYTLTNLGLQSSGGGNETWRIELKINTTGYNGGPATNYIQSVAVKVSNTVIAGSLFSTSAPGTWTTAINSGLNNSNCSGSGSGFVCAQDGTSAVANGSTYTWVFDITMAAGGLFTGANQASIKANYNPPNGIIVSEAITLGTSVPEPGSLVLLGMGLVGLALRLRKKD